MERRQIDGGMELEIDDPRECARLIRKLRWIGLEEDAGRLEIAVSEIPADRRCSVIGGPFNTD